MYWFILAIEIWILWFIKVTWTRVYISNSVFYKLDKKQMFKHGSYWFKFNDINDILLKWNCFSYDNNTLPLSFLLLQIIKKHV